MKNVFIPPIINWNFLTQLPQQMANQFSKHGYNVFYCNINAGADLKKVQVRENLTVYPNWEYASYDLAVNKIDIDILYNTAAMNYKYVDLINPKMTIYHSCDSFEEWKPLESKMINKSDIILCTSKFIYDIRKKQHNKVFLARNGCNEEHINCDFGIMESLKFIKRPICVFSGACGVWVSTYLIRNVAKDFYTYFVGKPFGKNIPNNVQFVDALEHNQMIYFLRNMDIGLLPFNTKTEITKAANPIKLWEYLACGLPVIATDWEEVNRKELEDVVFTSKTDDEYIDNIIAYSELSLMDKLSIKEMCYKVAKNNTWKKRFEVVEREIQEFFK